MSREHLPPLYVWVILVGLTLGSVATAESFDDRAVILAVIFGIAIVKAQLVAVHFMETRHALPTWNTLYRIWIVMAGIGLCIGMAYPA